MHITLLEADRTPGGTVIPAGTYELVQFPDSKKFGLMPNAKHVYRISDETHQKIMDTLAARNGGDAVYLSPYYAQALIDAYNIEYAALLPDEKHQHLYRIGTLIRMQEWQDAGWPEIETRKGPASSKEVVIDEAKKIEAFLFSKKHTRESLMEAVEK